MTRGTWHVTRDVYKADTCPGPAQLPGGVQRRGQRSHQQRLLLRQAAQRHGQPLAMQVGDREKLLDILQFI